VTEHPCQGMTKAEIAAFEAIAINRPPHCSKLTLERLIARGVIERYGKKANFRDGLPSIITDFDVPLPVHIQWCEWASERYRGKL
jgi:hypothetical protein